MQSSLAIILLLATVAITVVLADPSCVDKTSEEDCFKCCRSIGFRSIVLPFIDVCECSYYNKGPCSNAQNKIACHQCCSDRYYNSYDWDWDFDDCTCKDKQRLTKEPVESKTTGGKCDDRTSEDDCFKCCRSHGYRSIELPFVDTCQCSYTNKGPCSDAQNKIVCHQCCSDRYYRSYDWDWDFNDCTCKDKQRLTKPPSEDDQTKSSQWYLSRLDGLNERW